MAMRAAGPDHPLPNPEGVGNPCRRGGFCLREDRASGEFRQTGYHEDYPMSSHLQNGGAGRILVASCLGDGDTGGGLFAIDGGRVDTIDRISCTGLCLADGRLCRALWTGGAAAGELVLYDSLGVERYYRVDQLADPHDVIWDGTHFVAASALNNAILWISTSGEVARCWRAPGDGDAWHLNGLFVHGDQLLVCAFGRYAASREWKDRLLAEEGLVFELETGREVLTGLCAPHNPRLVDGAWAVCNSARNELLRIEASSGTVLQRVLLESWPRGFAVSGDLLYVGESANRCATGGTERASIAVLSRKTWEVLDRIPLPCREVYDLLFVPAALVDGARRGFRTNPLRVAERNQHWLFEALGSAPARILGAGEALRPEDCRVAVQCPIPPVFPAGQTVTLNCSITNMGEACFVSAPPHPVHLSYRWQRTDSSPELPHLEGVRTPLESAVLPQGTLRCPMEVLSPARPGEYLLRITLVQESVRWFDDLTDRNGVSAVVRVE